MSTVKNNTKAPLSPIPEQEEPTDQAGCKWNNCIEVAVTLSRVATDIKNEIKQTQGL